MDIEIPPTQMLAEAALPLPATSELIPNSEEIFNVPGAPTRSGRARRTRIFAELEACVEVKSLKGF